jgi:TetR/AcrR family transcriptional repressor of lmrAB and yxaGH operons
VRAAHLKAHSINYFPDGKEQLVSEAVLQAGRALADRIRTYLAGETPPVQAIHDFILRIADHVEASGFTAGSPLTAVAMETVTTSPRINAACQAAFELLPQSVTKGSGSDNCRFLR